LKKIYIGNLPFTATEDEIRELFGQHGTVHSVALINDREPVVPEASASSKWTTKPSPIFLYVILDSDYHLIVGEALAVQENGTRSKSERSRS
jgi:RNA recognition motif-containing protein